MKLFWKEHIPLLLFYILQMALVPLLYWLTGEGRPFAIVFYGILLSTSILAVYLGYRYLSQRTLYKQLNSPPALEGEALQPMGETPLAEAVYKLFGHYDRHYQEEGHRERSRMDQHIVFINRWVHQMKTPLSVIQLMVQELEDTAADSVREELERLRKGLEMVIYTSRLERFEQDFMIKPTALQLVVNQTLAENRQLFIRKGITPKIQLEGDWKVSTDPKWLQFMINQILINAANYTADTGKNVFIRAYEQEASTVLEIRDQGIGIVKEDLKRVFNPYFTGERGRQYHESTGMGLYLVREVCDRLGHKVELDSEPGVGTVVRLIFGKDGPLRS
ncbi:sensor histidine kinase [Aneurinibacillus migulanus]|uniref:histidine kinase n=1 Tax=Aneurinibacillus migulanus TaxID=47500 RepID=A0A0D1WDW7_ANEMI|nr:sensor histidine kinase [Aneurinibacillus migulanus]KIV56735.1 membrane protein [Aneurinibacillus migulanus]KON97532.1 membrane protein [Aneurinibacillus migulanus]MED0894055.1 sensor histidine kinase [Aneurinibacillus migulanus]MED1619229.1 sensor histidine kinase [Aneurinibacillus migulanus]SDK37000.1 Signal transduction histidine kinase [Aneurinibacillus migulanus]